MSVSTVQCLKLASEASESCILHNLLPKCLFYTRERCRRGVLKSEHLWGMLTCPLNPPQARARLRASFPKRVTDHWSVRTLHESGRQGTPTVTLFGPSHGTQISSLQFEPRSRLLPLKWGFSPPPPVRVSTAPCHRAWRFRSCRGAGDHLHKLIAWSGLNSMT